MLYTYSGHRNCPGQKGLKIDINIYLKIDKIYGPSSWTVNWHMENGILYANDVIIGGLDTILTQDKRTVKDVLLSKKNIIANIGEKAYNGYRLNASSAKDRGFAELAEYLQHNDIRYVEYKDNRKGHGWYGVCAQIGAQHYEISFDWPYTKSKEINELFDKLKQFINPIKLQLLLD